DEVYAAFDRALALDPNNANFALDAATAAVQLGDLGRARDFAETCSRLYPRFAPLHALLGYVALAQDRLSPAFQDLWVAVQLTWPDKQWTATTYSNLSATLLKLHRPEDALHAASLALTHWPQCPDAHFNRARALELLGRQNDAAQAYRELLALRPDHGPARAGLGRVQSGDSASLRTP